MSIVPRRELQAPPPRIPPTAVDLHRECRELHEFITVKRDKALSYTLLGKRVLATNPDGNFREDVIRVYERAKLLVGDNSPPPLPPVADSRVISSARAVKYLKQMTWFLETLLPQREPSTLADVNNANGKAKARGKGGRGRNRKPKKPTPLPEFREPFKRWPQYRDAETKAGRKPEIVVFAKWAQEQHGLTIKVPEFRKAWESYARGMNRYRVKLREHQHAS